MSLLPGCVTPAFGHATSGSPFALTHPTPETPGDFASLPPVGSNVCFPAHFGQSQSVWLEWDRSTSSQMMLNLMRN